MGSCRWPFGAAPDRRVWGKPAYRHTDPNSYLVLVRSQDGGLTWSPTPQLIMRILWRFPGSVHGAIEGSLDIMHQLRLGPDPARMTRKLKDLSLSDGFAFLGGYILRSRDGGHAWDEPNYSPILPQVSVQDVFGKTVPAYNRGAMCEGKDGRLFWVVANGSLHKRPRPPLVC